MARPRVINPTGKTRRVGAMVSEPVVRKLEKKAKEKGVTVAEVIREALEKVA